MYSKKLTTRTCKCSGLPLKNKISKISSWQSAEEREPEREPERARESHREPESARESQREPAKPSLRSLA